MFLPQFYGLALLVGVGSGCDLVHSLDLLHEGVMYRLEIDVELVFLEDVAFLVGEEPLLGAAVAEEDSVREAEDKLGRR